MATMDPHAGMDHGGMGHGGMDHGGMDHSGMDHSGMDHSGMDHGSMDLGSMDHGMKVCSSNPINIGLLSLFTTDWLSLFHRRKKNALGLVIQVIFQR